MSTNSAPGSDIRIARQVILLPPGGRNLQEACTQSAIRPTDPCLCVQSCRPTQLSLSSQKWLPLPARLASRWASTRHGLCSCAPLSSALAPRSLLCPRAAACRFFIFSTLRATKYFARFYCAKRYSALLPVLLLSRCGPGVLSVHLLRSERRRSARATAAPGDGILWLGHAHVAGQRGRSDPHRRGGRRHVSSV